MSDMTLFLFGTFVFGLLGLGVGYTVAEFRAMTRNTGREGTDRRGLSRAA